MWLNTLKKGIKHIVPTAIWKGTRSIVNQARYHGDRFHCPLCKSNLSYFLPFGLKFKVLEEKKVIGAGYRKQAQCPVCQGMDRERLVYLYLKYKTTLFEQPHTILHVAPEHALSKQLQKMTHLDYISADLLDESAMVKMDICHIPYPGHSIDVIICNHVLEHIPNDKQAMSELFRVLKPNGWAILQVPLSPVLTKTYEDQNIKTEAERETAFGQYDHVRIYGFDYIDRLNAVGFQVYPFKWESDSRFSSKDNRYALNQKEQVILAKKGFKT